MIHYLNSVGLTSVRLGLAIDTSSSVTTRSGLAI